jgi:hypothetical protein
MKKLLLGVATAGLLFVTVPSFAQDIGVSIGERGVRVIDRDRDYRREDYRRDRRIYTMAVAIVIAWSPLESTDLTVQS